jgi:TetR/AcrR family transcriptional repressor of nem operon
MARPREFDENEVVNRAAELFWEKGYRRTTPSQLVEATGLSKSSLYATFGSKHALFLRALERYVDGQEYELRRLLDAGTLRDGLGRMYARIVESTTTDGGRSCLVCTAAIEVDSDESEVISSLADARERTMKVFAVRVRRAQAEGDVSTDRNAADIARFIFNNNMGMVVSARANTNRAELEAIAAQVVSAICG